MSLGDDVGGDSPGAALSQQHPNIRFDPVNKPPGGHGEAAGKTQTIVLFVVGGANEVFYLLVSSRVEASVCVYIQRRSGLTATWLAS